MAAMIGPAPKPSVTVVPAAWTAAVSFFLVSRIQHHPPTVDQYHVPQQVGHLADEWRR
jgi:hypothetical protein